jgi:hypothetical protein
MKICLNNDCTGLKAFLLSLDLKLNSDENQGELSSTEDSAQCSVESLVRIVHKLLKQCKKVEETERETGTDFLRLRKESSEYSRIKSPKDFSASDEYDPLQQNEFESLGVNGSIFDK